MQHLGTYYRLVLASGELRQGDWVVGIDDRREDLTVSVVTETEADEDTPTGTYLSWDSGAACGGVDLDPAATYVVMRRRDDDTAAIAAAAREAVPALTSWLWAPSGTFTCAEAASVRRLIATIEGPDSELAEDFDRWHASTDDGDGDCSHTWYLALQADPEASRP